MTYPGLPGSKHRPLAQKYRPRGGGGAFASTAPAEGLIGALTLWSHLADVGDAKSLIIHPASTTHRQLGDEELQAAGVGPGTAPCRSGPSPSRI